MTLISVFNIVYSTFNSFRTQEQGQEATKKFREEKLHFNKEIQATKDVLRKQSDQCTQFEMKAEETCAQLHDKEQELKEVTRQLQDISAHYQRMKETSENEKEKYYDDTMKLKKLIEKKNKEKVTVQEKLQDTEESLEKYVKKWNALQEEHEQDTLELLSLNKSVASYKNHENEWSTKFRDMNVEVMKLKNENRTCVGTENVLKFVDCVQDRNSLRWRFFFFYFFSCFPFFFFFFFFLFFTGTT